MTRFEKMFSATHSAAKPFPTAEEATAWMATANKMVSTMRAHDASIKVRLGRLETAAYMAHVKMYGGKVTVSL